MTRPVRITPRPVTGRITTHSAPPGLIEAIRHERLRRALWLGCERATTDLGTAHPQSLKPLATRRLPPGAPRA